ncbi:hypothetical protein Vc3S01_A1816 [Vibrio campbellii]|nr:hypothetical protein Vc3S01_A1816 [Vibrio campbellii]
MMAMNVKDGNAMKRDKRVLFKMITVIHVAVTARINTSKNGEK